MIKPIVAYTAWTFDGRVEFIVRYNTIFEARTSTRKAIEHFRRHGLTCRVHFHYIEPASGGFEVGIVFARGIDDTAVWRAIHTEPPFSNRGVTR